MGIVEWIVWGLACGWTISGFFGFLHAASNPDPFDQPAGAYLSENQKLSTLVIHLVGLIAALVVTVIWNISKLHLLWFCPLWFFYGAQHWVGALFVWQSQRQKTRTLNILDITKGRVWTLLLKVFPSLGYKGVVDTQIACYRRLKKKFPTESENDLLNILIMSRIQAPFGVGSKHEEYTHYEPLLQSPNKTLEDVIWAIVEYEYILSREEHIFSQFSRKGFSHKEIAAHINILKSNARRYIKESIEKNTD
jgi:hypothetical protein